MSNCASKSFRSFFDRKAETPKAAPALLPLSAEEASQVSGGGGGLATGASPIQFPHRPGLPGPLNPNQW